MNRLMAWTGGLIAVLLLTLGVYLAWLFVAHDFNPDFLAIDRCLDRGGAWNYEAHVCELGR